MVKAIPDGYHSVTPYLIVKNASEALDWYKRALDVDEKMRLDGPDGSIMHAEFQIGDSMVMIADENPQMGAVSPDTLGGSPMTICLYVENVDELFAQAIAAGGTEVRPLENQFYGDRSGTMKDPYGHTWTIATHVEDVDEEEIAKRVSAMFGD